jgi:hypothetical protein
VIEGAVTLALEQLAPQQEDARRAALAAELASVSEEHAALTVAIGMGGDVRAIVALVERLQALEARRADLTRHRSTRHVIASPMALDRLERRLREEGGGLARLANP